MAGLAFEVEALNRPLFESKQARSSILRRLFASTTFLVICCVLSYRIVFLPRHGDDKTRFWIWIGMFISELWFCFYWMCTQAMRWNVMYNLPFKDRLSKRYEGKLPRVDVFVCTADPVLEPPVMVVNTVLSVMAYNYPTEKLAVYLSDDGGSDLTFYALLEASRFAEHWIPFCKKYRIEPRSPVAYFNKNTNINDLSCAQRELLDIKKLYEEMKRRIERAMEDGCVPKEIRKQHKGFLEWDHHNVTKRDHQPIVEIMIDGRDTSAVDINGCRLPTLVYMSRERRPQYHHNFKAGAMNALLRVSSKISNGSVILNLDCDMYANDPDVVRDALCFLMDEHRGHGFAYMQYPQKFENITKNDLYANSYLVSAKVELPGLSGYGAAPYCGTGCFHRREAISGMKHSEYNKENSIAESKEAIVEPIHELEEAAKIVASCSYERDIDPHWGKQKGLVYGFSVEDVATGLAILYRGWKSVLYTPSKEAFLGVAPCSLEVCLIQHTRWSEGLFMIFMSKYCPFLHGFLKLKLGAQLGICTYLLWAVNSLPNLYYLIFIPLCLLARIPLFPQVSSPWFAAFAYVYILQNLYSVIEALNCGYTLRGWLNTQRMNMFRRTTAHLFGFIAVIFKLLGLSEAAFVVTAKVETDDIVKRYKQELLDFGSSNIMFVMIATMALLHVFALIGAVIVNKLAGLGMVDMAGHAVICLLVVLANSPVYDALFRRTDKGSMPREVAVTSIVLVSTACILVIASSLYVSL